MMHTIRALFAVLLLAGCVSTSQQPAAVTPAGAQQSVFASKSAYLAGLRIVQQYQALPVCPAQRLCKEAATEQRIVKLANSANDVLSDAEAAVRTPGYASDKLITISASAQAAVRALTVITDSLKTE